MAGAPTSACADGGSTRNPKQIALRAPHVDGGQRIDSDFSLSTAAMMLGYAPAIEIYPAADEEC